MDRDTVLRTALRYLLLAWVALIFIFPVVFMVISSLKPDLQLLRDSSSVRAFLPVGDISLGNYSDAMDRVPLGRFVFNSIFVTVTMYNLLGPSPAPELQESGTVGLSGYRCPPEH